MLIRYIDFVKINRGLMGCKINATKLKWEPSDLCYNHVMCNDYSILIFKLENWFPCIIYLPLAEQIGQFYFINRSLSHKCNFFNISFRANWSILLHSLKYLSLSLSHSFLISDFSFCVHKSLNSWFLESHSKWISLELLNYLHKRVKIETITENMMKLTQYNQV